MKNRYYFIANSSSSSFIIEIDKITKEQIDKIINHIEIAEEFNRSMGTNFDTYGDWVNFEWDINIDDKYISGKTVMDNFDMKTFLNLINVKNVRFTEGIYTL